MVSAKKTSESRDETIVAIITPPGEGGIAALRLDGRQSLALLKQFFRSRGNPEEFTPFVMRYGVFTGAEGIKTPDEVALYGGVAGEQYDPCYHLACDTFANVSEKALEVNSDAVAFATLKYAMSTETINDIPGKGNFKERKLQMDANMGKFEYLGNRLQR